MDDGIVEIMGDPITISNGPAFDLGGFKGVLGLFWGFSVFGYDIQEGLNAGIDAGVCRVAVELKGQRWFCSHNVPEVPHQEGVWSAAEVGDPGAEELGMLSGVVGGLHKILANGPVHIRVTVFILEGEHVPGDDVFTARCEFCWDAHIGFFGEGIIGPAKEYDGSSLGVILQDLE